MSIRTDRGRRLRWWGSLVVLTASAVGVAYLLDPVDGRARRARIADRAGHLFRVTRGRIERQVRYDWTTLHARGGRLLRRQPMAFAEGRALLDRVESELFTDRTIPHGRLTLDVAGTTVVLRGQVDSPDDIARIEAAAARVEGVSGVKNLLHLAGTPAPNKLPALLASAAAAAEERT